jgi:RNA polymerase-binding transcription factor DksA
MSDHAALRRQLEAELETLTTRLGAIQRGIQRPKSADFEEQATDSENDEVLDALDVVTRDKILGLRAAIRRIDEGRYGACQDCGKPIGAARLEAVSWAARCVDCAD